MSAPDRRRSPSPTRPGGLSSAREVGFTHRDHQNFVCMRPVGEAIDLFQVAEEIRLLNHQGGDILPAVALQRTRASVRPADRSKSTLSNSMPWLPAIGSAHLR